jgi:hypothetical protein
MQHFPLWMREEIISELVVVRRRHHDTLMLNDYHVTLGD